MEKTFEEACVCVRAIMEGRWRAACDEEKARILEREKHAIMGYEEEILDYQKAISEILREEGLGAVPCPSWYRDAAEGVFAELYGLAGLTPWVYDATPAYRDSSSAKLIGDRLYCLIDGKSVLQPQRISRDRRAQLLGGRSAPGDVFMEDWLRYWMDELIKPNCEETTCHGYENILNTHMIPSLGRLYVQDLTPVRVQQYYGELRKKGLANNTIRKHHVLLHAALGAAVRQGIVGANVTCLVTPPAREAPQHRFYDSSQLRMLFCASEGTPLEVAVKLAGCLGLRRSEICGLKWRNVDLKRGVLTVCEVRTAVSGRALEKAPKSYASERRLAFGGSEDLEALLKRLHRDWERRRKQDPKYNPEGYVAVNEAGKPYQPDVLCQRIAQFIAAQGLPPISLHGLRHSFASVANSQNVPMFSISKALGHSSTSVTSAVYMHLFDDAVADVVSQVASAITGAEP